MFDHIQLKVHSIEDSRVFYERVLKVLGHKVVLEIDNVVVGIGESSHCMLELRQATGEAPLSQSVHIALRAHDKGAVNRFHAVALENGATDNGAPGYRPEYEEGYYAAFVTDIDGHNLEAVYSENPNLHRR